MATATLNDVAIQAGANDEIAADALAGARSDGLQIPYDLSMAGPAATTVSGPSPDRTDNRTAQYRSCLQ